MSRFAKVFGADLRSLALLRICIGLLVLANIIHSSQNLVAFYSDSGVLPRAALMNSLGGRWLFSLHFLNGTWQAQLLLLCVAGVAALALCAGYRTRLATFITWLLFLSLNTRNPLVLQAGDIELRMILFWGLFLPWGERFSVDALVSAPPANRPEITVSMGTAAYLVQIVLIYLFGALLKSGPEWGRDGSAVYYALNIDQFATPVAYFLLQFPNLLTLLTFTVYGFELFVPIALLLPFFVVPIRIAVIAGLVLMHLSFGACLAIGLFTWIGAVSPLGLLPTWVWEKMNDWRNKKRVTKAAINYYGDCAFCRRTARFVSALSFSGMLSTARVQGTPAVAGGRSVGHCPVVIDAAGNQYHRHSAFIRLSMDSSLLRHVVPVLRMAWVRSAFDRFYDLLDHPQAGVSFKPRRAHSDGPGRWLRRGRDAIAGLAIVYVLIWNVATLPGRPVTLAEWYRLPGEMFGLEQSWYMFAPFPLKDDGWYVIPGKLRNGRVVDLFRGGGDVTWKKPASVAQTYPDYRWRKYMMNLIYMPNHHRSYLEYLCRDWNGRYGPDVGLEELVMVFVLERTLPNYEYFPPESFLLASHRCAAHDRLGVPAPPSTALPRL